MTELNKSASPGEIKRRFRDLEAWSLAFTARLENTLQTETQWKRIHCFIMDQFEEAFAEEHLSRDQKYVFISLRVAIDLKDQDPSFAQKLRMRVREIKDSLLILNESFHDSTQVIDLDWHISEKERNEDQGAAFASRVLSDCLTITKHLEKEKENDLVPRLQKREQSLD